jgi:hypothetical protein
VGVRRLLLLVALVCAPAVAHAGPVTVSSTIDFTIGGGRGGGQHGFIAPGGHFDLGVGVGRWRAQAELDAGLWTRQPEDTDDPDDGGYHRVGLGVRYVWLPAYFHGPGGFGWLNNYVQLGIGRDAVHTDTIAVSRSDVEIGFGMAQEAHFGHGVVGGNFGLRVVIAGDSSPAAVCAGAGGCPEPSGDPDVALFFDLGFVVGGAR